VEDGAVKYHVLMLPDARGGRITELHILGVGVTQYDYESDDPNAIVLDYLRLNTDEPELTAEIAFLDPVLRPVRGGWRGCVHLYEDDTLTTGKTRRGVFEEMKGALITALANEVAPSDRDVFGGADEDEEE
jgi:hypothetical protein